MTPPIASGIISISRLLGFMRSLSLRRSLTGSAQMVEEGQTSQSLSKFGPNEILSDSGEQIICNFHIFLHIHFVTAVRGGPLPVFFIIGVPDFDQYGRSLKLTLTRRGEGPKFLTVTKTGARAQIFCF